MRVARVPERQTDLEELVNGPPVSASFKPDGTPTPAAAGFASKQGVDVAALERVQTPKGEYIAFRKRQRGKAAIDVLPARLGLDTVAFRRDLQSSETRARHMALLDEAAARGAFGVPTFFLGDRMFRGNDRLPLLEAALRGAGLPRWRPG